MNTNPVPGSPPLRRLQPDPRDRPQGGGVGHVDRHAAPGEELRHQRVRQPGVPALRLVDPRLDALLHHRQGQLLPQLPVQDADQGHLQGLQERQRVELLHRPGT